MPLTSDIGSHSFNLGLEVFRARIAANGRGDMNRPGFPGECFICELRLPDHRF